MHYDLTLGKRTPLIGHRSRGFLVEGVGTVDVDFVVTWEEGSTKKYDKSYAAWRGVLRRCFNEKLKNKYPTYSKCSLAEQWLSFSNFDSWFVPRYRYGYHIDKDILFVKNKVYGPDTCILVPSWVNNFVLFNSDVAYPLVHKTESGKWLYKGVSIRGVRDSSRIFESEAEALSYFLDRKQYFLDVNRQDLDEIDNKLYSSLSKHVEYRRNTG